MTIEERAEFLASTIPALTPEQVEAAARLLAVSSDEQAAA